MHSLRETLAKRCQWCCSRVLCDCCSRGKVSKSKDDHQGSSTSFSSICFFRTTPVSDLGSLTNQLLDLILRRIICHRNITHQRNTMSSDTLLHPPTTHDNHLITCLNILSSILILNILSSILILNQSTTLMNTFLSSRFPTLVLRRFTR